MSRKITFLDFEDFYRLYLDGWPEARIARHFRISRTVVRRIFIQEGWSPRTSTHSNRFNAEERTLEERRAYTAAANVARRKKSGVV